MGDPGDPAHGFSGGVVCWEMRPTRLQERKIGKKGTKTLYSVKNIVEPQERDYTIQLLLASAKLFDDMTPEQMVAEAERARAEREAPLEQDPEQLRETYARIAEQELAEREASLKQEPGHPTEEYVVLSEPHDDNEDTGGFSQPVPRAASDSGLADNSDVEMDA